MSNICTCTNQGFWPQDGQQSKLNNNYTAVNEHAFGCSLAPEAVPEHNLGDYSRPEIPLYLHSSQIYECRDLFLTLQPLGVLQKNRLSSSKRRKSISRAMKHCSFAYLP